MEDARDLDRPDTIYESLIRHIVESTNAGRIEPRMTVFAPSDPDSPEIKIWNHQLIGYAGYRTSQSSILGDPINAHLTEIALSLGWSPPAERTRFDLLPLLIQIGSKLHCYPLPEDSVLRVRLRHPKYSWFETLGLEWYALPAVSNMLFVSTSGVHTAAPFSGWYMGTEIGVRDLGDEERYNQAPVIAERMGWDLSDRRQTWRDQALLVLNEATLHSFDLCRIRVVDHHRASKEFMHFCHQERKADRSVSADWSWIVPPISGSATPVYQEPMRICPRLPNFIPRRAPWSTEEGELALRNGQRQFTATEKKPTNDGFVRHPLALPACF